MANCQVRLYHCFSHQHRPKSIEKASYSLVITTVPAAHLLPSPNPLAADPERLPEYGVDEIILLAVDEVVRRILEVRIGPHCPIGYSVGTRMSSQPSHPSPYPPSSISANSNCEMPSVHRPLVFSFGAPVVLPKAVHKLLSCPCSMPHWDK